MKSGSDPFGYFARKAARESLIRSMAPYRIDSAPDIVGDYDALEARLKASGLGVDLDKRADNAFSIFDLFTGHICGRVYCEGIQP